MLKFSLKFKTAVMLGGCMQPTTCCQSFWKLFDAAPEANPKCIKGNLNKGRYENVNIYKVARSLTPLVPIPDPDRKLT